MNIELQNMELLIAVSAVLLMYGFAVVRWQRDHIKDLNDFNSRWQGVDVHSLLNLIDKQEESYLRENLSVRDFRFIYRKRLLVIWEYLSRLSANARLMVRAGQMIQHASEGQRALEARDLVTRSIKLRMFVLLAQCSIAAKFVFPQCSSPIASLVRRYAETSGKFGNAIEDHKLAKESVVGIA